MSDSTGVWSHLKNEQPGADDTHDRIVFLGDAQDAHPRLLVLDLDLSSTEKILWMYLRLHVDMSHKSNPCPTYGDMMHALQIGSRETLANALLVLRGTRWLSVIGPRRDFNNRVTRNLYALHSEPIAPADVIELDQDYLSVLDRMQAHRSSKIRELGTRLDEGMQHHLIYQHDPSAPLANLNTRLEAADSLSKSPVCSGGNFFVRSPRTEKPAQLVTDNNQKTQQIDPSTIIVLGPDSVVRKSNLGTKNDEKPLNTPSKYDNRTTISSSSSFINTTTTENRASKDPTTPGEVPHPETAERDLDFHLSDLHLSANEKRLLEKMVMQLPDHDRQQMLDEIAGQIVEKRGQPNQIRNTISFSGYLIKLYLQGTPSWTSSFESMAKKRIERTQGDQHRADREAEHEKHEAAARVSNAAKLAKWEAELNARKTAPDPINPASSPTTKEEQS